VNASTICGTCQSQVAAGLLACPVCHTLVHAERLKDISRRATEAGERGDPPAALSLWREALALLPSDSRQYQIIAAKIEQLAESSAKASRSFSWEGSFLKRSWGAILAILVLVLTKGKFLLGGLAKLPTLFSMLASFGVYWTIWGWKFALGIILTTYVHEMGHVAALVRYGIKASAPMFVPGLGAYVRLHQHMPSVRQDARVGLAGPLWGLAAGLVCYLVSVGLDSQSWRAIAQVTGLINLFNLLPIWQLDGGRAFTSMSTRDRWLAVASLGIAWYASGEGILLLIGLVAGWRAFQKNTIPSDTGATALYAGLVLALGWLISIDVSVQR
jgi:Zn-dependent protease